MNLFFLLFLFALPCLPLLAGPRKLRWCKGCHGCGRCMGGGRKNPSSVPISDGHTEDTVAQSGLPVSGDHRRRGTLLSVVFLAALPALFVAEAEALEGPRRLSFTAVGDVLIHSGVYKAAAQKGGGYDFRPMFRLIRPRIEAHDLAFCNQESILGGVALGLSGYPRFNSPQEVGDAVVGAGFNLISLANNHTLDRGEKAILRSLEYWSAQRGVTATGSFPSSEARDAIPLMEVNGISCAFLAYTTLTNGLKAPAGKEHYVNVYSRSRAMEDVTKAGALADLVMVSMHWGNEYTFTPSAAQREIARDLASWGVHLVIGHHPHVVQPVEMVDGTLVIFSLGNFLSSQKGEERNIGLLVSLDVVRHPAMQGEKPLISFENVTGTLLYNPSRSRFGRYVVIPFDLLTADILAKFPEVHARYAARVRKDRTIAMRAPAAMKKPAPKSGGGQPVRK